MREVAGRRPRRLRGTGPKRRPKGVTLLPELLARAEKFTTERRIKRREQGHGAYSFSDLLEEALKEFLGRHEP